ncbi:MAG: YbaB/EbfC family nucleoid-associated protein [Alphaproteobacteria bacterium]|nr:YbaB/EbfC family nucleoid-associated protein [Alphaproteobacteria bacterium]
MTNIGQMMKKMQEMQSRMSQLQSELADAEVTGSAGGGMVSAVMNGKGLLKRVKLDTSLINPAETEVLEDLVVAAVNDAKSKADAMAQNQLGKLTGGLPLPPGFKLPL